MAKQRSRVDVKGAASLYSLQEAIDIVREGRKVKFDGSVDIAVRLHIDTQNPHHMLRTCVALPHGTGKVYRVLVIATPDKMEEAKQAGADYVGGSDYLERIASGWTDFDVLITVPAMMAAVGKLGSVLGPLGLMPSMKTGTVTDAPGQAVQEIKAGKITVRPEKKGGILHASVGRVSFDSKALQENIEAFVATVVKAKPHSIGAGYVKSIVLSSTMGKGVRVSVSSIG